jgi:opacity protein-like surface antigen
MRTLKLTILALALASAFPVQAADLTAKPAGMTEEQQAEFNRIAVKTEALEDGRDASGFKNLKISGYADVNYIYNVNKQRGGFQFLVPNSAEPYAYDNSYFGSVALDLQKETDGGTKFHLTLIPARSTGDFIGGASIVHEASVSIPVEAIGGKVFAGQLPDWSGYEYLPPTQNKLITHNLLFDFTLPYVYTGVGIEKAVGKWVLKGMLANVNESVRKVGENVPVFACRGDYSGGEFWGLGFACLGGKMANLAGGKDTLILTGEVDGWYTRGDLTLNAHVAYGQQDKAAIGRDPVTGDQLKSSWYGASVLAAYKVTPRLEGVLRADFIGNDKNGGGLLGWSSADAINGVGPADGGAYVDDPLNPGTLIPDYADPSWKKGADKYAITAGLSYAIDSNATFKLEYRYDGATQKVFGNKDLLTGTGADPKYLKSNSLISTGVVVFF